MISTLIRAMIRLYKQQKSLDELAKEVAQITAEIDGRVESSPAKVVDMAAQIERKREVAANRKAAAESVAKMSEEYKVDNK